MRTRMTSMKIARVSAVLLALGLLFAGAMLVHTVAANAGAPPKATDAPLPEGTSARLDCPIDSYEPNDSFGAADGPISTGIAHCAAYICPSNDEDWFKFSAIYQFLG